jgi:N-acetylmuramoyl-L-alanine amidase
MNQNSHINTSKAPGFLILLVFAWLYFYPTEIQAQNKKFTVVLDAGHGGHDPGAIGRISREKDITLAVVKLLGSNIEKNMKDVRVLFTRSTDVFIPLEERAQVANNNNADLFISVHVNAARATAAFGAETYTLGLAKTRSNLDVAMTENSVILLEDNYQTKYRGFDPNSVESYIMFEFMMDKYLDKSIEFATNIQKQFAGTAKRSDRGVRQAGFWVLHRSACPSVLIELGFISNYSEELFLSSDRGQQEMAGSIYNAFIRFKREHDKKLGYTRKTDDDFVSEVNTEEMKPEKKEITQHEDVEVNETVKEVNNQTINKESPVTSEKPVYKIQIKASAVPLKNTEFKGQKNVDNYREGGMIKYTVGADTDYNKILKLRKEILSRFPDAFIIAFVDGKKIPVNDALKIK